jgi:hypothetical protein
MLDPGKGWCGIPSTPEVKTWFRNLYEATLSRSAVSSQGGCLYLAVEALLVKSNRLLNFGR